MNKNIFTIPAGADFVDALADGLWRECQGNLFELSTARIFLPTRRACLYLRDAFLERSEGVASLLPRMQPLGDIDSDELYFGDSDLDTDLPPAITPLRRAMLLTQLVAARDPEMSFEQAGQLADALARFLDEAQIMQCDFGRLKNLVIDRDLAEHWKQTVSFLDLLTTEWPKLLEAEGCLDPAVRRNRLMMLQAEIWRTHPPAFRIIAAGSTGSIPATAALLDAIASLPQGTVILPGLDQTMDEASWQVLSESHPQSGLKNLLSKLGTPREVVRPWQASMTPPSRVAVLQEAMRPAEVTDAWQRLRLEPFPPQALYGLAEAEFDHPQEEAQAIALMMRETIEDESATATLVTPDRGLAERVAVLLTRWNVNVNDSGGTSLTTAPIGTFLTDLLEAAAPSAGAVDMLALLKHPLAAFGLPTVECRARARSVEMNVWRKGKSESSPWLQEIVSLFAGLRKSWETPLPLRDRLIAHLALAELAAKTDTETGSDRLWADDAGNTASEWLNDWQEAIHDFPALTGDDYAGLFGDLLRKVTFRPSYGQHARLSILGPLEARLIQPDLVILGGLNEGTWPMEVPIDPWMSRPMKKDFGLPLPEFRVGLAAHDFVQLASAPRVMLTRARRAGNAPTIPSRFLLQLQTILKMQRPAGSTASLLVADAPWQIWARKLDEPEKIEPCAKPQPRPPVNARPKQLSVTDIGMWQHNPYAIYARYILRLKKLEPLDAPVDASDRGTIIHDALDRFMKAYPITLPPDPLSALRRIGKELFAAYAEHPQVTSFWWPRFERIATWFVTNEIELRSRGVTLAAAEALGRLVLPDLGFILSGRADRIDREIDGALAITDYKTGGTPTGEAVKHGLEPQLQLLALIAEQGGFEGVPAARVTSLSYWKLTGGRTVATTQEIDDDVERLVAEARTGLQTLIATFADASTPYEAVPKPSRRPRFDDYAHLARHAEWGRTGED